MKAAQPVFEKLYAEAAKAAQAAQQASQTTQGNNSSDSGNDDIIDGDYKEV